MLSLVLWALLLTHSLAVILQQCQKPPQQQQQQQLQLLRRGVLAVWVIRCAESTQKYG
jgi:hypothetical protein